MVIFRPVRLSAVVCRQDRWRRTSSTGSIPWDWAVRSAIKYLQTLLTFTRITVYYKHILQGAFLMIFTGTNPNANASATTAPCQLGYTRVCNSDKTTLSKTALCPADRGEEEEEEKEECSCLQRTLVEENLLDGVNPLGRDSRQCFQVPSEMIFNLQHSQGR